MANVPAALGVHAMKKIPLSWVRSLSSFYVYRSDLPADWAEKRFDWEGVSLIALMPITRNYALAHKDWLDIFSCLLHQPLPIKLLSPSGGVEIDWGWDWNGAVAPIHIFFCRGTLLVIQAEFLLRWWCFVQTFKQTGYMGTTNTSRQIGWIKKKSHIWKQWNLYRLDC